MAEKKGGLLALWKSLDKALAAANKKAKRILFFIRLAAVFMVLTILGSWTLAGLAIWRPDLAVYFYLGAVVLLSIGLIPWAVLIMLPLKLKSVTRLIDKGYPANAKELGLRTIARKLHDESIETEELLFDTAINEGKKVLRRMQEKSRAEAAAADDWVPRDPPRDAPRDAPRHGFDGGNDGGSPGHASRRSDDDAGRFP